MTPEQREVVVKGAAGGFLRSVKEMETIGLPLDAVVEGMGIALIEIVGQARGRDGAAAWLELAARNLRQRRVAVND
jgi:methylthioribose-1-phosphate isomerase